MDPVMLWLVRAGAVTLAAAGGYFFANTTPEWTEDQAREEPPPGWRWGYYWHSNTYLTGSCLSSMFGNSGGGMASWLSSFVKVLLILAALGLAYYGWPTEVDSSSGTGIPGDDGIFLLFYPGTWVLLGSFAAGYVAGILLRKPVT